MPETLQTVCIVEDDESVRRALQRLIRSVGLTAEGFATAEEFLQFSTQTHPSCLILDMNLPGLSGLQLQRRMNEEGRKVPVVVITAYQDEEVRKQALQAGAIAFLQKPFEELSLLQAVSRVVN
jgi:FixJ family two-component response regulator